MAWHRVFLVPRISAWLRSMTNPYPNSETRAAVLRRLSTALDNQDRAYEALVFRIQAWMAISTAVAGVGLPFGLSQIPENLRLGWVPLIVALVPGVLYVAFIALGWVALRQQGIQLLQQPGWYRNYVAKLPLDRAETEMLLRMELAYDRNQAILVRMGEFASWLRRLLPALAIAVIGYAGSTTALKVFCSCE